ncbi:arylphorin subunit alpha-like [Melitaea cinxia]|uniref:arylphorin subunit alpha-like n=1 Tax=Melitaea cinxia TaxID=113334 RepID=UPI001E271577|nr:arylphorin subunit alpha-like [Melitaea cinxia]
MKTVVALACLALGLVGASLIPPKHVYKTKQVDADFGTKQEKILKLFLHPKQVDPEAEYYKIGKDYDIKAHFDDYTNKKAVQEFYELWSFGMLPKNVPFSIFYKQHQREAIALFNILYYANSFEVFYKTACFARVYLNEGQFFYAFYIALTHHADTKGMVVPAPYEVYPELFTDSYAWNKIYRTKMQDGVFTPDFGSEYGVVHEGDKWIIYSNYSDYFNFISDEYKISYFTEDIGLNAYYYYFHSYFPFWMDGDLYPSMKENRGEVYFYFYQQLLARYYLERLSNGLGPIPNFSFWHAISTGYYPNLYYYYPFVQRPSYYQVPSIEKYEELQFLDTYEKTFIQYLHEGRFKAFNQDVDLHNSKSVNFVGNFWQANADWYGKVGRRGPYYSYEVIARNVLSAAPQYYDKYNFAPSALDFYQTSLRDPVFYQLYSKIIKYFIEYKKMLPVYTKDSLHYVGVKVNDVKVEKLVTFFDYYDFDVSNGVYYTQEELKSQNYTHFFVRQPRLNHKDFKVYVDLKSDVEGDAVVKIFMGPKYDHMGYPISLEDNWMNFVELDWSVHTLTKGQNKIERSSSEFFYFKEDSVSTYEIFKTLPEGKVPLDMSAESGAFPKRLLLPKGTKSGFPYQFFVMVYPYVPAEKYDTIKAFEWDSKPFGYPFDRPAYEPYFVQPNMFFEDVEVYHEGEEFTYKYNVPYYTAHNNEVASH